ncbi:MAG: glycerophosphodiester phosphodiesterase [Hyphomicrobiales bacterium]|nr:glycerophosphodiester phosphodiesterase [Hyphomicrobiales bacterium]
MRALNAPAWLTERPIAHRGLHDAASGVIENTLQAAEAAIAGGFAIECDIQISEDGEVFVFHDDTLDRLTDAKGALIEMSAATIRKARFVAPSGVSAPAPLVGAGRDGGSRRLDITESTPAAHTRLRSEDSPTPHPNAPPQGGRGLAAPFIPTFAEFLALVAGRTPIICELKSRFGGDWRIADRAAALALAYEGRLALESFDPDLVAYLRLRRPLGGSGRPCPIGVVAQASYDDPAWDVLTPEQKCDWTTFEHFDRLMPDFLSWRVDDLPHKVPFLMKELNGAPVMAWTVRNAAQREAARKWADQIVFEGEGRP